MLANLIRVKYRDSAVITNFRELLRNGDVAW